MSITTTETNTRRALLKAGKLKELFAEIGWDNARLRQPVSVDGETFTLTAVAQKRDVYILECVAGGDGKIPPYKRRRKIQVEASKVAAENILIFVNKERTEQVWHWVRREKGRTVPGRDIAYHNRQSGDVILQTLVRLTFTMQDEYGLNLLGVLERVNDVSRRESVTRDFYNKFNEQHATFLRFIENIPAPADARWYASVLINRVMFLYFIQSKGFLLHPKDAESKQSRYLQNRLAECSNALYL